MLINISVAENSLLNTTFGIKQNEDLFKDKKLISHFENNI